MYPAMSNKSLGLMQYTASANRTSDRPGNMDMQAYFVL